MQNSLICVILTYIYMNRNTPNSKLRSKKTWSKLIDRHKKAKIISPELAPNPNEADLVSAGQAPGTEEIAEQVVRVEEFELSDNTTVKKEKKVWTPKTNDIGFDPDILYEDEACLVIDKPSNIMAHPDEKVESYTISDWMGSTYPESIEVDQERPGIVHRLDRDTSGCMLLVKSPKAYNYFKAQFQDKTIKKVYLAIVAGNLKDDTGIIDTPIARARSDFRKREVKNDFTKDYRGEEREAITRYKVVERINGASGKFSVVECFPLTGRTHQIRVHMRSIRHPIVGDKLYGSRESAGLADRQMLHAIRLEFKSKSQKVAVSSPLPKDFEATLEKLRQI